MMRPQAWLSKTNILLRQWLELVKNSEVYYFQFLFCVFFFLLQFLIECVITRKDLVDAKILDEVVAKTVLGEILIGL